VRWWKTKKTPSGKKIREKKSREKVIEIITTEKDGDTMSKDQHIMNKIRNKLGLSIDAKVDIVIIENTKEQSLGMSNDVY
jgi:hypothetical protein